MPAGLTLYNTAGTVQIDQSWQNYGYRQKIPVTITAPWSGIGAERYQLVVSGSAALLCACKAASLEPFKMHSFYDGANWTFNWYLFNPLDAAVDVTETVEFWIFDVLDGGSYSNVGMEVWIDGGPRVFHSDAPMMKIGAVQGCNNGFSFPSGKSFVPLIMRNPICGVAVGGVGYRLGAYCLRTSGAGITSRIRYNNSQGASGSYTNVGAYAAVDVTGL